MRVSKTGVRLRFVVEMEYLDAVQIASTDIKVDGSASAREMVRLVQEQAQEHVNMMEHHMGRVIWP